jgi:CheY-like chemotaxis protein
LPAEERPSTIPPATRNEAGAASARDVTQDIFRALRHDLRTPINHVIGYSELLLEEAVDTGLTGVVEDLEKIRGAGRDLLAVVNERLDPTRTSAGIANPDQLSHDLRTPLNAIIGYSELLQEEVQELGRDSFVPDLAKVHVAGRQLLSLVNGVLDLSRAGQFAPGSGQETALGPNDSSVPAFVHDSGSHNAAGHMLVVDDNETNRDMLSRRLVRLGHTIAVAENGRVALEMLRAEAFDLVLLDVMMPVMNGFQVLHHMKADEQLRHLPVIVLSASDETESAVKCIELGAEDYLPKPFDPVLLRARIGACLEKKILRDQEAEYLSQIEEEKRRSNELLHVILPDIIVQELKETNRVEPRRYDNVAVMFCDIVGFTDYCDKREPHDVMPDLQRLVEEYEEIAARHTLEKIKTIGDSFMAAAGLLKDLENPVLNCVQAGLEMIAAAQALSVGWNVRVGVNIGPVIAGVMGNRQYLFDLFGDTVNTAARMESYGHPGSITLSAPAWNAVARHCRGTPLGMVDIKGKGQVEMFRLEKLRRDIPVPLT